MAQKMTDIRIPSLDKKIESLSMEKRSYKKWFLFIFVVILAVCGYFYFDSYRVEVVIWPAAEDFSEVKTVSAGEEGGLRTELFKESVSGQREFTVLGRSVVETKTKGTISVCQEYSDNSQPLIANTRFVSTEGKLFISEDRITVPGRSYEEGKVIPGCVTAPVVAAEAGEDYNISATSKFSLPALHGTALYGRFYGDSFSITQEGSVKEVPVIDEEELSRAERILSEELLEEGKDKLKHRLKESFVTDSGGQYSWSVVERSLPEKRVGEEKFDVEMTIEVEVIAVDKRDFNALLLSFLPEGYIWHEENKKVEYDFPRANFNQKSGEMVVSLDAVIYKEISVKDIKEEIAGTGFDEARRVIREMPNISDVSLRFLPFGPSLVPNNTERIKVDLSL